MLFLEFNLNSYDSELSEVPIWWRHSPVIKSMTNLDGETILITQKAQSSSRFYFVHKDGRGNWDPEDISIADFAKNPIIDYGGWWAYTLSIAKAGNFFYVGHTMGLTAYAFGKLTLISVLYILPCHTFGSIYSLKVDIFKMFL